MSALHDSAASLVRSLAGSLHSSLNSLSGLGGGDDSFSESPEIEGSQLSLEDQLIRLKNNEYQCYCRLKSQVEEANIGRFVNDELILHFAQCSPGKPYNSKTAWDVIRGYDPHNWSLKAKDLLPQLETQTLFPLPGLRSSEDHAMFYMNPSRFVPTADNEETIVENLVYVIKSMRENHTRNRTHGIGLLINMDGWEPKNFSKTYWVQFMRILEGTVVPARIEMVLIVNPPKSGGFHSVFKLMKATLSKEFLEKIHRIPEAELHKYLQSDYAFYLPEEMAEGLIPADEIVTTWIAERMEKEATLGLEL
ncbi:unnamed protein product [Cylindrotheca closterium]|uniref:CRAL-TRIO domain-containing protein n=1 Tax=Cylindrotheca closterium TaxID=2856 RepID=A0AAD2CM81_9STRA|nr:unnamed protein product [Cylindrotheca closterium]